LPSSAPLLPSPSSTAAGAAFVCVATSIVLVRPTAVGVSFCVVVAIGISFAVAVIASIVLARSTAVGVAFVCVAIVSAVGTGVV
jgi:hypothetical protein